MVSVWVALILVAVGVLVVRLCSAAPLIDNSVGIWFMQDDPEAVAYQQFLEDFGEREWTLLLLETESIYAPEFLEQLSVLIRRIEALDHVYKATAIANVRDNLETPDGALEYSPILSDLDASALSLFRQRLHANPLFEKSLFQAGSDTSTVVLIQNDNRIRDPAPYRIELVDAIDELVRCYSTIRSHALTGTTVVNAELNRASQRDVLVFYVLISVLVALVGWLLLRNVRDVVVMVVAIVGSVVPAMAMIAAAGLAYNMVTVMLPTILVSLSIAGVIHVIHTYHQHRAAAHHAAAVGACVTRLRRPVTWTSLTTALGFGSFATSTVAPVAQLGLFACSGILLAWAAAIVVAPALIDLLWARDQRDKPDDRPAGVTNQILALTGAASAWWVAPFAMLLIPLGGLSQLRVDTDYTEFFGSGTGVTRAYDAVEDAGYGQSPLTIALYYPDGTTYASNGYFEGAVRLERAIAALPEVTRLLSATELLRTTDRAFNGPGGYDRMAHYSKTQVDQLLFLGELSGNDDFQDFLTDDRRVAQIIALTPYLSSRDLGALRHRLQRLHEEFMPSDSRMVITGTTVLWANMDQQISDTQLRSLAVIALFLCVLLPLIFRSITLGLIGLIVNGAPLAITLGLMALCDIRINVATVLIGAISLGVVVDDTIHFMHRFTRALSDGTAWAEAVDVARSEVGPSIIVTTLVLIGGFGAMATSTFLPTAHFGIFLSLSLVIALLMDLVLLPFMLRSIAAVVSSAALRRRVACLGAVGLAIALLGATGTARAEISGAVGTQSRLFLQSSDVSGTGRSARLFAQAEVYREWDAGARSVVVAPYVRIDDAGRTHADLREALWNRYSNAWSLSVGIGNVFWGVTESQRLVDVINQTDALGDVDGRQKLGQPMVAVSHIGDWGVLEAYLLPGFRPRQFAPRGARLGAGLPVDESRAVYESGAGRRHVDAAVRYAHTFRRLDLGVSWFSGRNRDPRLVLDRGSPGPALVPHYDQMHQLGVEAQLILGNWLLKLEGITRSTRLGRRGALATGFEYTFGGAFGKPWDLAVVAEYHGDDRPESTHRVFDHDVFSGLRLSLNDTQNTRLLAGVTVDLDSPARRYVLEATRRLGQRYTLSFQYRGLSHTPRHHPMHAVAQDDHLQLELAYHF